MPAHAKALSLQPLPPQMMNQRCLRFLLPLLLCLPAFAGLAQAGTDTPPKPKAVMPRLVNRPGPADTQRPARPAAQPTGSQTAPRTTSRPAATLVGPDLPANISSASAGRSSQPNRRPADSTGRGTNNARPNPTPAPRATNPFALRPSIPRAVNLQALAARPDTGRSVRPATAAALDSLRRLAARRLADSNARAFALRMDSLRRDSLITALAYARMVDSTAKDSLYRRFLAASPSWVAPVRWQINQPRQVGHAELLFYTLAGLAFVLALIKSFFAKYFNGLFGVVFQTSFRQRQTRDLLAGDKLPSLLMNLFFVLTMAMLLTLLNMRFQWVAAAPQWVLLYAALALLLVYAVKFGFIALSGWAFEAREAANAYAFVVGLVNKVGAVLLLPLVLLFAFAGPKLSPIMITVFAVAGVLLLCYRYLMAITTLRGLVRLSLVHFLVYICAVEVLPLLIMYKLFMNSVVEANYLAILP